MVVHQMADRWHAEVMGHVVAYTLTAQVVMQPVRARSPHDRGAVVMAHLSVAAHVQLQAGCGWLAGTLVVESSMAMHLS